MVTTKAVRLAEMYDAAQDLKDALVIELYKVYRAAGNDQATALRLTLCSVKAAEPGTKATENGA